MDLSVCGLPSRSLSAPRSQRDIILSGANMKTIWILVAMFTVLLLASMGRPTVVFGANDGDDLQKLRDRVDVLEKTVLAHPFHPTQTVLSRLDVAEKAIKELQKHDIVSAKVEVKDGESLRKSLAELQKDSDDLNRRLKTAEDQLRRSGSGEANDLRDLKRAVDQLDRSVDDLKERVKRLESKK